MPPPTGGSVGSLVRSGAERGACRTPTPALTVMKTEGDEEHSFFQLLTLCLLMLVYVCARSEVLYNGVVVWLWWLWVCTEYVGCEYLSKLLLFSSRSLRAADRLSKNVGSGGGVRWRRSAQLVAS